MHIMRKALQSSFDLMCVNFGYTPRPYTLGGTLELYSAIMKYHSCHRVRLMVPLIMEMSHTICLVSGSLALGQQKIILEFYGQGVIFFAIAD